MSCWTWRRRYAKPDMGACESSDGVTMDAAGKPVVHTCGRPATHTVVGVGLLYPAYVCAECAELLVAEGDEAREGEWDVRRKEERT